MVSCIISIAHGSSKGSLACGERQEPGSERNQVQPSQPPAVLRSDHLVPGGALSVQGPPAVPLAQGGSDLRAEALGRAGRVRLVVGNVVQRPKPRGQVVPSYGQEEEVSAAISTPPKPAPSPTPAGCPPSLPLQAGGPGRPLSVPGFWGWGLTFSP